ncbi:expressed unknown protein [Seminavis robusta]|uniref:Uncharacterized protein n=1 Tax=Seminavis robusta TaxID=568900 RepID=A0A9N8EAZ2_9STRA|nr:expressed unknown protein [Seminavis robusta]|eukprot:Sro880_g215110.1 n/a (499) ;mRNA; r:34369-36128
MMMSKPQEAAAKPAEAKKTDAVADLERRLAMLGDDDPPPPMEVAEQQQPPAFAAPPAVAEAPAATGKNALLARIMAAQERAKQAKPTAAPEAPPPDIFDMAPPPAAAATPPPAFDDAAFMAPPQEEAPPAFDMLGDAFDLKPPPATMEPAAPPSYATAPPAPSAPTFEDLLGGTAPPAEQLLPPPPMPVEAQQPPTEEFDGLEGLSEAERNALLEEQRRIMAEIEQNKAAGKAPSSAISAADAFDQRSNAAVARIAGGDRVRLPGSSTSSGAAAASAKRTVKVNDNQEVALHGQERTRAAIADVVSPVDRDNAVTSKEEALQMEADRKLAEELQKEEYGAAERSERRQRRAQQQPRQQEAQQDKKDDSWWGWLGFGGADATTATTPQPQTQRQTPQYRGDMGVSRPPGAGGLQAVNTGSYDGEDRRLLGNSGGAGGARVAESKPLFACVADGVAAAATSFTGAMNTQSLAADDEGNVHGVDGSSLLVVSQAGRNQPGN